MNIVQFRKGLERLAESDVLLRTNKVLDECYGLLEKLAYGHRVPKADVVALLRQLEEL